ncbi:MAG: nitrite reductase [Bacteroidetes bacterium GWF2_38_335]|nr:MAG: nitrite reductase [Bacteroidetes bacterium GWF2_38_335]OFY77215.1 MAG: nitrite reductase [Bacteroidetes bacterium RIFOXYA12_FULL_38_20]HBS85783.1 nitrite reductase [Bacteroidales bacterium]
MKEEVIVSGRMNENIDPVLQAWHWEIPTYLFLGGLAAGILFFAALFYLQGNDSKYRTAVKIAPFIVPIALALGLFALFLDLTHKLYFWKLYTTIKFESPMSWGAWVLMIITPLSIMWILSYSQELFDHWKLNYPKVYKRFKWVEKLMFKWKNVRDFYSWIGTQRKIIAWVMLIMAIVLGVYTGILLSAFNARPLWNTSVLGMLFLVSGLSTGAATVMWLSKNEVERKLLSRIDLILIIIELFLIVHMFMGFLAGTQVQIETANMFLGGDYTLIFWITVVFMGLLLPLLLEFLEYRGYHIPVYLPAGLIIFGGVMLRIILLEAGQASRYLY